MIKLFNNHTIYQVNMAPENVPVHIIEHMKIDLSKSISPVFESGNDLIYTKDGLKEKP